MPAILPRREPEDVDGALREGHFRAGEAEGTAAAAGAWTGYSDWRSTLTPAPVG